MKRMFKFSAVLVGLVLVAACGDDGPTSSGDELSTQEVNDLSEDLTEAVVEGFFTNFGGSPHVQNPGLNFSGGAAAVPFSVEFDVSESCEGAGTVTVSGTISGDIDAETGSGTLNINMTQSVDGCVVSTESGVVFTVTSNPDISITGSFSFANNQPTGTITFSVEGGFDWVTNDDRSGNCGIDLTISAAADGSSASANGTVCGRSVNVTATVG